MRRIRDHISYLPTLISLWLLPAMGSTSLFAQEQRQEEGEVLAGEVIINKNLDIELPPANRVFEKVPPRSEEKAIPAVQYNLRYYDLTLPDLPVRLRVLKLKGEKLPVYSGNYLTLGFGNYLTPFIDFGLNSTANPSGYYGVHLRSLSSFKGPVDKDYSSESNSSIAAYGLYAGRAASIHGRVDYDRQMVHFYGYPENTPASKDTLKQVFNRFDVNFQLKGTNPDSPFDYSLEGGVIFAKDKFVSKETAFNLNLTTGFKITDGIWAGLNVDFLQDIYNYGDKISRTLVRGTPYAIFNIGDFKMNAGMNLVYITDTLNYKSSFKVYPKIEMEYVIQDHVNVYAGLDGDIKRSRGMTLR